jgi:hypothetical protein
MPSATSEWRPPRIAPLDAAILIALRWPPTDLLRPPPTKTLGLDAATTSSTTTTSHFSTVAWTPAQSVAGSRQADTWWCCCCAWWQYYSWRFRI